MTRALSVTLAVLALAGCGGKNRSYTFDSSQGPPSISTEPSGHAAGATERRAARIARVHAPLVAGTRARLAASSLWTSVDGAPLGVELAYALPRPIDVDTDLPYAVIPPDAPAHGDCVRPYAAGWLHLSARHVTRVFVLVDLRRNRVVDVSTNAVRGTVGPVEGKPFPSCEETG